MDKIKQPVYTKMPSKVRVLGRDFKIHQMADDEMEDADGFMMLGEQSIGVRKQARGYMQDTLLHETIHAIDETLLLGMTEQQVSNMASVLLAVLKDNPAFTSWILQNE